MTFILALLLATGPVHRSDAGELLAVDVERAAVLFPGSGDEAGRVLHLDGGMYVATPEWVREAKQLSELRARNEDLESHASDMPTAWVAAAFGVGAALGVAATLIAVGVVKHP